MNVNALQELKWLQWKYNVLISIKTNSDRFYFRSNIAAYF